MERDAKAAMVNGGTGRMTPLWKKHMANKKLVTTTILNFQIVFFAEPFFNVHSFWGWVGVAKGFFTTTSGKVILNGVFVSPWAGPSKSICFPSFLLFAQG